MISIPLNLAESSIEYEYRKAEYEYEYEYEYEESPNEAVVAKPCLAQFY